MIHGCNGHHDTFTWVLLGFLTHLYKIKYSSAVMMSRYTHD